MYPSANGKLFFEDEKEMYYNLFLELGLGVNNDQYVYDQDTGIVLKFQDQYIKMNFNNDIYPGKNDIIFDPSTNYHLIRVLFGYYIDKERENGNDIGYIADYKEEENQRALISKNERFRQRFVVKTKRGDIKSDYFYNIYLAYIHAIFIISGNNEYDLSNFDILPEV